MLIIEIIAAILLLISFIHLKLTKRKYELRDLIHAQYLDSIDEFKRTLLMGLYFRFNNEKENKEEYDSKNEKEYFKEYTDVFINENPYSFEHFVAEVFEKTRGGFTNVLPGSGDFGVDFEHIIDGQLYLGQVKCYKNDLPFNPIALIHSNMVKKNAEGGYVITTSGFSEKAKQYAKGLNIELIDGIKLVEMWLESLKVTRNSLNQFEQAK